jgi:hypothetical protein
VSIYEPALHNNNERRAALAVSLDDFFLAFSGNQIFTKQQEGEVLIGKDLLSVNSPGSRG